MPRSLFGRLALALFSLMAIVSVCQILVTIEIWRRFQDTSKVEIYRNSANEIARQIEPNLAPDMTAEQLSKLLFRISSVSPDLRPSLVTENGVVVGSLWPGDLRIPDLSPVREFLSQKGNDQSLHWLENPATHDLSLFSAARIQLPQGPGYVVLFLDSREADLVRHSLGDFSVAVVGISFGLLALASTSLIGYLVFRQITRRYRQNSIALQSFEAGDYSVRLIEEGADEVAAHARAFNKMAETIVATISKLEQVDSSRRALIAAVTHDLRRPLTNIALALDRFQRKAGDSVESTLLRFVSDARTGCNDLEVLIEDLFELSRLEAGEELRKTNVNIEDFFSKIVLSLGNLADLHKIALSHSVHPAGAELEIDPERIERLLKNLLDNAILYAGDGSSVTLSAVQSDSGTEVWVKDTGKGIPQDELEQIFDWFFRGETSRVERPQGSGLGLAICKRITELHRATIEVESQVGRGTAFRIFFPNQKES